MYTLNNDFELSKTTLNHAKKRDMYVEYFKYDSKKDNEQYGHTLFISPISYEEHDGGIYFKVTEYENGEFVGKLSMSNVEEQHEEDINEYFSRKPEMKIIKGEKELRKFVNEIYEFFM